MQILGRMIRFWTGSRKGGADVARFEAPDGDRTLQAQSRSDHSCRLR
jgi:hypothetical protein